jgi:hypothetical protein
MIEEIKFRQLLHEYLLPMFPGSSLGDNRWSKNSNFLVTYYGNQCSLLLQPCVKAPYRLEFSRSQPFDRQEKRLVELFIRGLFKALETGDEYFLDIMGSVQRRLIGDFLVPESTPVVSNIIQHLESLTARTYEGHRIVTAIGMTGNSGESSITLDELWQEDFSAVLSNGFDTIYVCGNDGHLSNLEALPLIDGGSLIYVPNRFAAIATWCADSSMLALVLNRNGEILVFQNSRLQFAKRDGTWHYYPHDSVMRQFSQGRWRRNLRETVYESCLDVSFARTGGCLAICRQDSIKMVNQVIHDEDLITEERKTRTKLLSRVICRNFDQLDRRLRQELLAMDGATVLSSDGTVITAGAIVQIPGGSSGGGRRAAAVELSKLGLGIKISSDGPITGFRNENEIFLL